MMIPTTTPKFFSYDVIWKYLTRGFWIWIWVIFGTFMWGIASVLILYFAGLISEDALGIAILLVVLLSIPINWIILGWASRRARNV